LILNLIILTDRGKYKLLVTFLLIDDVIERITNKKGLFLRVAKGK